MSSLDAMRLSTRNWHWRGTRSATWRPSSPPGWSPRRSGSSARTVPKLHRPTAEYPISAEVEQRCIRMLADLFTTPPVRRPAPAPRLLGGDHARRPFSLKVEMEGAARSRLQVDRQAEPGLRRRRPRGLGEVLPLLRRRTADRAAARRQVRDRPEDVEPLVDENTIGVAAVLGTTFTGHADDIVGINKLLVDLKGDRGIDVPLHIDGASGGFRLALPTPPFGVGLPARAGALDQRLRPQVRARLSRHRLG